MENINKINEQITIAGQPSREEIQGLAQQGFRNLVNLRTADEPGIVEDEERLAENSTLSYSAIPISPDILDDRAVAQFSQSLASVGGQPALVHCKGGGRAGVLTMLHLAIENGWSLQQTLEEAEKKNIAIPPTSPYRAFFDDYIRRHSPAER